jgi:hypothetical protein
LEDHQLTRDSVEDVGTLLIQARQCNPRRWSGNTRDWSHIGVVSLNPERDSVVNTTAASALHTQQMAA